MALQTTGPTGLISFFYSFMNTILNPEKSGLETIVLLNFYE